MIKKNVISNKSSAILSPKPNDSARPGTTPLRTLRRILLYHRLNTRLTETQYFICMRRRRRFVVAPTASTIFYERKGFFLVFFVYLRKILWCCSKVTG